MLVSLAHILEFASPDVIFDDCSYLVDFIVLKLSALDLAPRPPTNATEYFKSEKTTLAPNSEQVQVADPGRYFLFRHLALRAGTTSAAFSTSGGFSSGLRAGTSVTLGAPASEAVPAKTTTRIVPVNLPLDLGRAEIRVDNFSVDDVDDAKNAYAAAPGKDHLQQALALTERELFRRLMADTIARLLGKLRAFQSAELQALRCLERPTPDIALPPRAFSEVTTRLSLAHLFREVRAAMRDSVSKQSDEKNTTSSTSLGGQRGASPYEQVGGVGTFTTSSVQAMADSVLRSCTAETADQRRFYRLVRQRWALVDLQETALVSIYLRCLRPRQAVALELEVAIVPSKELLEVWQGSDSRLGKKEGLIKNLEGRVSDLEKDKERLLREVLEAKDTAEKTRKAKDRMEADFQVQKEKKSCCTIM